MSPAGPELSVIIPAYNEALRLPRTLERIAAYARASTRLKRLFIATAHFLILATVRPISSGAERGHQAF